MVYRFIKNKPEIYHAIIEIKPYEKDKNGNKKLLLPAKELGLPKRYEKTWARSKVEVLLYRFENEIIWGLTAEIINEFINFYLTSELES